MEHHPNTSAQDLDPINRFPQQFPDEILLRIFGFIPLEHFFQGVCSANRRFRTLGRDSVTEVTLDLDSPHSLFRIKRLLSLCPRVRNLTCSRSGQKDSANVARYALEHCPMLEELRVDVTKDHSTEIGNLYSALATSQGLALRRLRLVWGKESCPIRVNSGLTHLSIICSSLDENDLAHIGGDDDGEDCRLQSFSAWFRGAIEAKSRRSHPLRDSRMIRQFLLKISGSVRKLSLQDCFMMRSDSYETLAQCRFLESLRLKCSEGLPLYGLKDLMNLRRLKGLSIECVNGNRATQLKDELFFSTFSSTRGGRRRRLEGLERLRLVDCPALTDAGLSAVARSCPGLSRLSLRGYDVRSVTEAGIRRLKDHYGKRLRVLELCPRN